VLHDPAADIGWERTKDLIMVGVRLNLRFYQLGFLASCARKLVTA